MCVEREGRKAERDMKRKGEPRERGRKEEKNRKRERERERRRGGGNKFSYMLDSFPIREQR